LSGGITAKKEPKAEKGRGKKHWSGDERRNTPAENSSKDRRETAKGMQKGTSTSSGGLSKHKNKRE